MSTKPGGRSVSGLPRGCSIFGTAAGLGTATSSKSIAGGLFGGSLLDDEGRASGADRSETVSGFDAGGSGFFDDRGENGWCGPVTRSPCRFDEARASAGGGVLKLPGLMRRPPSFDPTLSESSITRASISRRASGCGGIAAQRIATFFKRRASMSAARTSGPFSAFTSR